MLVLVLLSFATTVVWGQRVIEAIPKLQFGFSFQYVKNTNNGRPPGGAISLDLIQRINDRLEIAGSLEGGIRRIHDRVNAFASSSLSIAAVYRPIPSSSFIVGVGGGVHHMNAFCGLLCIDYEGPFYEDIPIRLSPQFSLGYSFKSGYRIGISYIPLTDVNLSIRRPDSILEFNPSTIRLIVTFPNRVFH